MATTTLEPRTGTVQRSWVIDWLTTVDHKKIGILYIVNSFLFFFAAGILALVIRSELAVPGLQFVDQDTYNQAFTMHGTIMLFLFIIPALSGFANYIVPLQLGAPDMAFPRINALSFWLLPLGGGLIFSGYLFGGAAAEGWTAYAPLTSEKYGSTPGTDLWTVGLLSFSVWAHHMFTTGKVALPFFALMTALIGVPTGVKMFNWLATLWRGKLTLTTAMLFALGFISMFLIGGISGVMLSSPPIDFHVQDTYFVVAHLHYVFFGGSVFGVFAATYYWFPKMTGRRLNEPLGKVHFWIHFIGFNLAFFPMHQLGLDGMPRRVSDYSPDAGWTLLNFASTVGAFMIAVSVIPFLINVIATFINGEPAGDDPWEGNTLEWATTSPPPPYNFDRLPPIHSERPLFFLTHGHGHAAARPSDLEETEEEDVEHRGGLV